MSVRRGVLMSSMPGVARKHLNVVILRYSVLIICTHSSCEYGDGCEWRETKAKEAQEKYLERKFF